MNTRVTHSVDADGVAHVRLARPERMNALDGAMFDALLETAETLRGMRSLRAVVLSGDGRSFCAGLDTASFERIARGDAGLDLGARSGGSGGVDLLQRTHGEANGPQQAVLCWRELPVPVIAALHGAVLGGGFQLAMAPDLRFAAPGTKLSILEVAWGLVPDMAGMVLLRQMLPDAVLRELVYSARTFGPEEAKALGLVNRICDDPVAEALAFAREIAGRSPSAIRAAKRLLDACPRLSTAELLLAEAREQQALLGSPNQREAVAARLEGRPGQFADAEDPPGGA